MVVDGGVGQGCYESLHGPAGGGECEHVGMEETLSSSTVWRVACRVCRVCRVVCACVRVCVCVRVCAVCACAVKRMLTFEWCRSSLVMLDGQTSSRRRAEGQVPTNCPKNGLVERSLFLLLNRSCAPPIGPAGTTPRPATHGRVVVVASAV